MEDQLWYVLTCSCRPGCNADEAASDRFCRLSRGELDLYVQVLPMTVLLRTMAAAPNLEEDSLLKTEPKTHAGKP